jgi:polysaccharide export outer membrane protein
MRRMTAIVLSVLALFAAAGASAQDYRIRPGDRLEVTVLEDPALNRQLLVGPDGRISLPLAGSVTAEGMTVDAVARALRSRLARDFIEPPTVTVSLAGVQDPRVFQTPSFGAVYVIGQVGAPGRYDVEFPINMLQMLATAGGPGPFAALGRVQLRRSDGDVTIFDYRLVENGEVPINLLQLGDGDVIVVPERGLFE